MKQKQTKQAAVKIMLVEFPQRGFHIFVNLKLNGKKCRFLIDTGASKSVVDKKYFETNFGQKSLKTIKQETRGLHGSVPESYYGKVKTIEVGKHILKNYEISAVDLSHVNGAYAQMKKPKIQGILGSELMLKYKMIIDYGNMQVILP